MKARFALAAGGAVLSGALCAQTVIKTDASWERTPATLSPSGGAGPLTGNQGTRYNVTGNVYTIAQSQGKDAGANLFHSFEAFSVGAGDAALFTTSKAFSNVISRVSGSSPTQVNGLLMLQPAAGSAPNFFFINPAGVTFGAGAQVDVPAAFHVSTANYLRFIDKTVFNAGNGSDSTLTIEAPEKFGFLGTTRAAVAVKDGTTLSTFSRQPLDVVAGDVVIDRAALSTADGGDIRVIAVGSDRVKIPVAGIGPAVHGRLDIVDGGRIRTASSATQDAGNIAIGAGDITLEGQASSDAFTWISTMAMPGTAGNAGNIMVSAAGRLSIVNGALSADSYSTGNAGSITVSAASVVLDGQGVAVGLDLLDNLVQTGITTSTYAIGTLGRAGSVTLAVTDTLSILDGARIFSMTVGREKAGSIRLSAGSMVSEHRTGFQFTGIYSLTDFSSGGGADVDIAVAGGFSLNGAGIASETYAAGDGGSIDVSAGSISLDRKTSPLSMSIFSRALPGSSGIAGDVKLSARGNLSIVHGGNVVSTVFSSGAAGSIKMDAASMEIDRQGIVAFTGISSQTSPGSSGAGGDVEVAVAGDLAIVDAAQIATGTLGSGRAGSIRVSAANLALDGAGAPFLTGISSRALAGSTGEAGRIDVSAGAKLSVLNGAQIASTASAAGNAGAVQVTAGSAVIDGQNAAISTGLLASTTAGGSGRAGDMGLSVAGDLSVVNGGVIVSATNSTGDAGSMKVSAGNITIDSQGSSSFTGILSTAATGSGDGGDMEVSARGTLSVVGAGTISSASVGGGNAGSIRVRAQDIRIDALGDKEAPGIQASVGADAGDAGDIAVSALGSLSLVRAGSITSVTFSTRGRSGSVTVDAGTILLDGSFSHISADAERVSSGQTGSLTVNATDAITLSNGARLSIRNEAIVEHPEAVPPTLLSVSAPSITLKDAEISAESTGNVAASNIDIRFTDRLFLDPSRITTSANQGNGGTIRIQGGPVLWLQDSQITTSVSGASGNGGDIFIHADSLVLQGGFIQANTEGAGASGGNVVIDVQNLVPSGGSLLLGGEPVPFQPGGLNVIQAAAPNGLSGNVNVANPALDIAGSLSRLSTEVVDPGALGKDLCRVGAGSSLTPLGRGGLRPLTIGMIRPEGRIVVPAAQKLAHAESEARP